MATKKITKTNMMKLIFENGKLLKHLAEMGSRKVLWNKIDYLRNDYHVRAPIQIGLKITNRCNMRCLMCAQWGESGYHINDKDNFPVQDEIPFIEYQKLFYDLRNAKTKFYIWGGEPFLYKDIFKILKELNNLDLASTLVTNGYTLEENAEEIVETGLDLLFLSIDGPENVHDNIRNTKGAFNKMINGINAINRAKEKYKKKFPLMCVIFTICNSNVDYLYDTFKLVSDLDVNFILGYYSWFTSEKIGMAHKIVMKEKFNCDANSWCGYVYNENKIDAIKVISQIERLKTSKLKIPYNFIPNLSLDQIQKYYDDPSETFNFKKCYYPWDTIEIQPNGDVATCRDFPDYKTGNITENNIFDIINNEKSKLFRKELKKGLLPICSRCCGLMGL